MPKSNNFIFTITSVSYGFKFPPPLEIIPINAMMLSFPSEFRHQKRKKIRSYHDNLYVISQATPYIRLEAKILHFYSLNKFDINVLPFCHL